MCNQEGTLTQTPFFLVLNLFKKIESFSCHLYTKCKQSLFFFLIRVIFKGCSYSWNDNAAFSLTRHTKMQSNDSKTFD